MKLYVHIFFGIYCLLISVGSHGQSFGCTADLYLSTHAEGDQRSRLYEVLRDESIVSMREIPLLSDVAIAGIAYSAQDGHIWALDIGDNISLVRISAMGVVEHMADVELDSTLVYRSAMLSPDGRSFYTIGYEDGYERAKIFYEIELYEDYRVIADDISFSGPSDMRDLCVDPLSGAVYGYENNSGRLVQFGIDGQFTVVSPRRNNTEQIDALFFDSEGYYFGYSQSGKLIEIDILTGELMPIYQGPMADYVDGCSCPYRSALYKHIEGDYLTDCAEFEVEYEFVNHLGSSYTGIALRDTFPVGFEVIDISSNAVFTLPDDAPDHVLRINNIVFQTGVNRIRVTMRPAIGYSGYFDSQAELCCFPQYPERRLLSDDPDTEGYTDGTGAIVIGMDDELSIEDQIQISCDGLTAELTAPIADMEYRWDDVVGEQRLSVTAVGEYVLEMSSDCFYRRDTFSLELLPGPDQLILPADTMVEFGEELSVTPKLSRGEIVSITGGYDDRAIEIDSVSDLISFKPTSSGRFLATAKDENGCEWQAEMWVEVQYAGDIYVPTAFSPNGDQINDKFEVFAPFPGRYDLEIYDRWGGLIHRQLACDFIDSPCTWDGQISDESADVGSYMWQIKIYKDDSVSEYMFGSVLRTK